MHAIKMTACALYLSVAVPVLVSVIVLTGLVGGFSRRSLGPA